GVHGLYSNLDELAGLTSRPTKYSTLIAAAQKLNGRFPGAHGIPRDYLAMSIVKSIEDWRVID
ncbi:MAG TPA: hypothetical protein P5114_01670, partial [Hyphomicrobiaceae bacterium]|nr:hypothetical protein [Hyphomicrobiaceae bacterium]